MGQEKIQDWVPLVVASAANQYFHSVLALGLENADSSELIRVLEKITEPGK